MGSYNYYYGRYYNQLSKKKTLSPINYTYHKNSSELSQRKRNYYSNSRVYNSGLNSICDKVINKLIKQIISVICFIGILIFMRNSNVLWAKHLCVKIDYLIKHDNSITYVKKTMKNLDREKVKSEIMEEGRKLIVDIKDGTFEKRITDEIDKVFNGIRQQV